MSFPIRRFELDPTGHNPANFVRGEQHKLGPTRGNFHAIAPYYGPFYNGRDTLAVYRNNQPLVYGEDYFGVVMSADETMKFNGEVCEILLVKGSVEGDVITVDMQVVGGLYQNYSKGLEDLWNAFIKDERPIDWKSVLGRPTSFNPSFHLHMIDDVVGWQPVLIALERLANAITLRNVPAFEELIDWVIKRDPEAVTTNEIMNMDPVDKMVTFSRLLFAMNNLNFNSVTFRSDKDMLKPNELFYMRISSTSFPREHTLYWDVAHEDTVPEMFRRARGTVKVVDNEASFLIDLDPNYPGMDEKFFRVNLRVGHPDGPIIAESRRITLQFNPVWKWDYSDIQKGTGALLSSERSILSTVSPQSRRTILTEQFWKGFSST